MGFPYYGKPEKVLLSQSMEKPSRALDSKMVLRYICFLPFFIKRVSLSLRVKLQVPRMEFTDSATKDCTMVKR